MPEDSEQNLINRIKGVKNNLQLVFFCCCWKRKRPGGKALRRTDESWIYSNGSGSDYNAFQTRESKYNKQKHEGYFSSPKVPRSQTALSLPISGAHSNKCYVKNLNFKDKFGSGTN